mmetsp:Transcript_66961/g.116540  ORF Transcript_66961/g.116540 Transcript_66961/m.116540 type:complete len:223 (-) Transcript_66961:835-1503(-)
MPFARPHDDPPFLTTTAHNSLDQENKSNPESGKVHIANFVPLATAQRGVFISPAPLLCSVPCGLVGSRLQWWGWHSSGGNGHGLLGPEGPTSTSSLSLLLPLTGVPGACIEVKGSDGFGLQHGAKSTGGFAAKMVLPSRPGAAGFEAGGFTGHPALSSGARFGVITWSPSRAFCPSNVDCLEVSCQASSSVVSWRTVSPLTGSCRLRLCQSSQIPVSTSSPA